MMADDVMVFFNDPVVVPDAVERAVRMTMAMREGVEELAARWRKRGHELHVGLGIPYLVSTIGFAVALAAILAIWYASERTLSIHSITTPRRRSSVARRATSTS